MSDFARFLRSMGRFFVWPLAGMTAGIVFSAFWSFGSTQIQPKMRVDLSHVWPGHTIPVCWEDDYADFTKEKGWVEDSVRQLLEQNSDYRFTGWAKRCAANDDAVRISMADDWPLTDIGYRPRDKAGPTFMRLNFKFTTWGNACASEKVGGDNLTIREHCIRTIAVHEMLHALGALHEQLDQHLKDKDPDCYRVYNPIIICGAHRDECGQHPKALTPYDHDSIMNYCRNGASGNFYDLPLQLSQSDKNGLKDLSKRSSEFE
jgi:Astacin (Peptidase family M12A)